MASYTTKSSRQSMASLSPRSGGGSGAVSDVLREAWQEPGHVLTIVIFGASGDLAKKKTYPALFTLFRSGVLPSTFIICGYARSSKTNAQFVSQIRPYLEKKLKSDDDKAVLDTFLERCVYRSGQYDDRDRLRDVAAEMRKLQGERGTVDIENRMFYLALPPSVFVSVAASIRASGMASNGWTRVVVEKPFGHNTASAKKLAKELGAIFPEKNLYRIDHYLGKEMVQNLCVLRFSNVFLEPLWNRNYVSSVQITFKEDIGTMGRGGYFDQSGIIRDVMQNHLMQVLSIVAMEPPVKVAGENYSDYVRNEKVKVLRCVRPIDPKDVVIGQYTKSEDGSTPGYLDDETVPAGSTTETFATMVLYIDNPRWFGVPFIMKA